LHRHEPLFRRILIERPHRRSWNSFQAKDTFAKAAEFANDVGLLAEEVLPETRELLGNFPQAFSHIGLVNAAWAISQLEDATIAKGRSKSSNL
jgi:GH15 family glucan-1,4-alpha-glucosidase